MKIFRNLTWFVCMALIFTSGLPSAAQDAKPPKKPLYETRKDHDPEGIGKFYMDREIAQVMGHLAAGWLERLQEIWEQNYQRLDALLEEMKRQHAERPKHF